MGIVKGTITITLAGSLLIWVNATVDKLSPEQIGMIWMALLIGAPALAVIILMLVKSDADRRMDHVERLERERTERSRKPQYQPPVVVVTGQLPRPFDGESQVQVTGRPQLLGQRGSEQ